MFFWIKLPALFSPRKSSKDVSWNSLSGNISFKIQEREEWYTAYNSKPTQEISYNSWREVQLNVDLDLNPKFQSWNQNKSIEEA